MNNKKLRITFNAPVILTFVLINLVAMLISHFTDGRSNQMLMTFRASLLSPLTYIRFFTHVIAHAGWEHFIGNMMYILLLGPLLEEKYGHRTIIIVMLVTALATGILNFIIFPNTALLGASGIVFAFILLSSFTGIKEKEIPITFILVAVIFLGQQVYEGIMVRNEVSNFAHIIGGVVGGGFGFVLRGNK